MCKRETVRRKGAASRSAALYQESLSLSLSFDVVSGGHRGRGKGRGERHAGAALRQQPPHSNDLSKPSLAQSPIRRKETHHTIAPPVLFAPIRSLLANSFSHTQASFRGRVVPPSLRFLTPNSRLSNLPTHTINAPYLLQSTTGSTPYFTSNYPVPSSSLNPTHPHPSSQL